MTVHSACTLATSVRLVILQFICHVNIIQDLVPDVLNILDFVNTESNLEIEALSAEYVWFLVVLSCQKLERLRLLSSQ